MPLTVTVTFVPPSPPSDTRMNRHDLTTDPEPVASSVHPEGVVTVRVELSLVHTINSRFPVTTTAGMAMEWLVAGVIEDVGVRLRTDGYCEAPPIVRAILRMNPSLISEVRSIRQTPDLSHQPPTPSMGR